MNDALTNSFFDELEKIAASPFRREGLPPISKKRLAGVIATGVGGLGAGYVGMRYGMPRILKALGVKNLKRPGPTAVALASIIASGGTLAALGYGREVARERTIRQHSNKGRLNSSAQSSDRQLAERHEGHSSEVPSGLLLHDAERAESVPLRAGSSSRSNRGSKHGADHYRRGNDSYRYRGKTPRNYNF